MGYYHGEGWHAGSFAAQGLPVHGKRARAAGPVSEDTRGTRMRRGHGMKAGRMTISSTIRLSLFRV